MSLPSHLCLPHHHLSLRYCHLTLNSSPAFLLPPPWFCHIGYFFNIQLVVIPYLKPFRNFALFTYSAFFVSRTFPLKLWLASLLLFPDFECASLIRAFRPLHLMCPDLNTSHTFQISCQSYFRSLLLSGIHQVSCYKISWWGISHIFSSIYLCLQLCICMVVGYYLVL